MLEIANQAGDTMCRWLGAVIQKIKEAGEYTPGGFLASAFTNRSFGPTNEDLLWKLQYRIIRELAEKSPASS